MATNEQIKQLVKAHYEGNEEAFRACLLRIAAYEAKRGHVAAARDYKEMADRKRKSAQILNLSVIEGLFSISRPDIKLGRLVVSDATTEKLRRIIREYLQRGKLADYGYINRRHILLEGAPGTGKTMTAKVIASELHLPLYVVQVDKLITKYMGETSVKLRQIFDSISANVGVYLFDEFDAIGADRTLDNEIGEMRRILNSFLQFIEEDDSESIIVAATNNNQLLDKALFRRFDDVLHYDLPTVDEAKKIADSILGGYDVNYHVSDVAAERFALLCQAEIVQVCNSAIKESLIAGKEGIDESVLLRFCDERVGIYDVNGAVRSVC